jgi:hypothetical protein
MTYTGGGGQLVISASTTFTQTGSTLSFGSLQITAPISGSYGMGTV